MIPEIALLLSHPWPYLATTMLIALMGFYAWRMPRRPGSRYFFWAMILWMIWALTAAIDSAVRMIELNYILWVIQCTLSMLVPLVGLLFTIEYTGNEKWLDRFRPGLFVLFFPPFLFSLSAIILPPSLLITKDMNQIPPLIFANDAVRWGFYVFIFFTLVINLLLLTTCMLSAHAFNSAILLIIVGQLIPHAFFIFNDPAKSLIPSNRVTLFASIFTAMACFASLYFYQLLQVIPAARSTAMNIIPYSVIVLDAENRLVDFNSAAQTLPGIPCKPVIGREASKVLGGWWDQISQMDNQEERVSKDIVLNHDIGEQHYHLKIMPLIHASGWRMGKVIVLEDFTRAWQAQQMEAQTVWTQATLQERQELAIELHDGLSQNLAFLSLQAQAAMIQAKSGQSNAAQASLTRLAEVANLIEEDTRELISNLISFTMPSESIIQSLQNTLSEFEQQSGLVVRFDVDGDSSLNIHEAIKSARLLPSVAIQLIRMTQEVLVNVRKHASYATHVNVQLISQKDHLLLAISDDGIGFDLSTVHSAGKHFGLRILHQRAGRIGGHVKIDSAPGKGTRVEIYAPYKDTGSGGMKYENSTR
jgi:signal transduction histidine kinase